MIALSISPAADGVASSAHVLNAPADSPKSVTSPGSAPAVDRLRQRGS
jgi:hypothetical protein